MAIEYWMSIQKVTLKPLLALLVFLTKLIGRKLKQLTQKSKELEQVYLDF